MHLHGRAGRKHGMLSTCAFRRGIFPQPKRGIIIDPVQRRKDLPPHYIAKRRQLKCKSVRS